MDYEVLVSEDAENDLDHFIQYLLFEKENEQAARSLLNDFEMTKQSLSHVAGSLGDCANPRLKAQGYKRIRFMAHRYFMLYRIEGNRVVIDAVFHELQDFES